MDSGVSRHMSLARTCQKSFLFYIVANVGPGASHRPLAIALRQGHGFCPGRLDSKKVTEDRVCHVIQDCTNLISIFTEPANRIALEAELALASAWYHSDGYRDPERVELPDVAQPSFNFSLRNQKLEAPELPWTGGIREFPFISTCLRLALNRDEFYGTRSHDVQEQPLGTVFRDDRLEYGMVVLDISNLDSVHYGIIGSEINYMADVPLNMTGDWDPVEGQRPPREPVPVLEGQCSRLPLSAAKFKKKFGCPGYMTGNKMLNKQPLIDAAALEYIWPAPEEGPGETQNIRISSLDPPAGHPNSILDRAVKNFIEETLRSDNLAREKIDESMLNHPDFQDCLVEHLRKVPLELNSFNSSTQLLRLAYAGHSHLNWVAYGNLTYETVAAALAFEELRGAHAISLCIDNMDGSPNDLFNVLSQSDTFRDVCFLQEPKRANDDLSSQLFTQLCSSSTYSLLRPKNITLTCSYSAPLRKTLWLPHPGTGSLGELRCYTPPIQAFPVQHMFVRYQYVGAQNPRKFWPAYYFLGDALLNPERTAVGFLEFARSALTDRHLFSFACAPPNLLAYKKKSSGLAVSPIPAENFAIPERCTVTMTTAGGDDGHEAQVECWPLVRDLEPGSWVILVSHEWYVSPDVDWRQPRPPWVSWAYDTEVPFLRYAFIRAGRHITVDRVHQELLGPESVEVVGGLKEFLHQTAPQINPKLIDKPINDTLQILKSRWPSRLGHGMNYLSVLDEGEARDILKDFLEDAPFVKDNVRLAMRANPKADRLGERAWYPNLLKADTQRKETPMRNIAIFKSLLDAGINHENPLGTKTKMYIEPDEDED